MEQTNFNSSQPEYYAHIGKDSIVKEGIFVRFPELIPATGEHYWREDGKHTKLLLIGESNYFNDKDAEVCDFRDAEMWYTGKEARLIPEYRIKDVSNFIGYKTFDMVFRIMDRVQDEAGITHSKGLDEAAFYNYFLRPAYNDGSNKGFKPEAIDLNVSGEALTGIIETLTPHIVLFLSKMSYTEYCEYCNRNGITHDGIVIERVAHPASMWWNREDGKEGKAKFESLIKEYWIKP